MSRPTDAVLFLHGQPGGARDWDRVIARLDSRAHAVAFDRPGWNGRGSAFGFAGNALAAIRRMDALGVERATVVGHSFGGAVAAWIASEWPDRVAALVLAAPSANRASLLELDRLLAVPVAGYFVSAGAMGAAGLALAARPVRRRVAGLLQAREAEPYLRAAGRVLLDPHSWRAFYYEQRALIRDLPELERRLDLVRAPTVIVAGSRDPIVPLRAGRELARQVRGAELLVVEGAGHLLPLEQPERLAEVIAGARG